MWQVAWAVALAAVLCLSLSGSAQRADLCPDGCKCYRDWLNCSYAGLAAPPGGPWPAIDTLWFAGNALAAVGDAFFAQLPALRNVYLDENLLPSLDLAAFAQVDALRKLRIRDNLIAEILAPPAGVQFDALIELDLTNNSLATIDAGAFLPFPVLTTLYLNDNPLTFPEGRPLLAHPQLAYLYAARTRAEALSAETFRDTPNLYELSLTGSGVPRLAGAFRHLHSLAYLYLQDNVVTAVDEEQLPAGGRLRWLDVSRNTLVRLRPTALQDALHAGYVYISDTPLACACAFEDLYRWAKEDKTWLTAYCGGAYDFCDFHKA
ncbi:hypothetical protein R5R35_008982 [Gryllus longicercus]|uniref:Uncharacterized protein n=1 Tax=Gryllus longicercus TaxID=2509291 RepID=A0AAN9Z6J8_9ORTH